MDNATVFNAFGRVLQHYRLKCGLTQEQLALEASFDRTFISRMERGLTQPSLSTLLTLASVMDVSVVQLMRKLDQELD